MYGLFFCPRHWILFKNTPRHLEFVVRKDSQSVAPSTPSSCPRHRNPWKMPSAKSRSARLRFQCTATSPRRPSGALKKWPISCRSRSQHQWSGSRSCTWCTRGHRERSSHPRLNRDLETSWELCWNWSTWRVMKSTLTSMYKSGPFPKLVTSGAHCLMHIYTMCMPKQIPKAASTG